MFPRLIFLSAVGHIPAVTVMFRRCCCLSCTSNIVGYTHITLQAAAATQRGKVVRSRKVVHTIHLGSGGVSSQAPPKQHARTPRPLFLARLTLTHHHHRVQTHIAVNVMFLWFGVTIMSLY